jgi:F0F1-type ATP synthase membrane subunit c/vacuolar-type H+-ATPase subunit K
MLKNILALTATSFAIAMSVSLPASAVGVVQTPEPATIFSLGFLGAGLASTKLIDSKKEKK